MKVSASLSLGVLSFFTELVAAGKSFWPPGTNAKIWNMHDESMVATLKRDDGRSIRSKLDMNKCLSNLNGRLIAHKNGNFKKICEQCTPGTGTFDGVNEPPTSILLQCRCMPSDGDFYEHTEINVGTETVFYGVLGTKEHHAGLVRGLLAERHKLDVAPFLRYD